MKHCKTPLSVNIRMRKKEQKDTKRRKCLLCTTTKEQWLFPITPAAKQQQAIEMWMGKKNILVWVQRVGYLHWALKHLFCLLRIILVVAAFLFCLSRVVHSAKKKEAADRAVSLNVIWIEWQTRKEKQFCPKKEFRVSDRFTDGYLWADKCYMLKHSEWVLLIHTTCLYVRLCMHQTFLPFIMALATCERRSDMKCIIK